MSRQNRWTRVYALMVLTKKYQLTVVGGVIVVGMVLIALAGPYIAPYDPMGQDLSQSRLGPSWAHPLGTDHTGRDVLSRILAGARLSLFISLASTIVALLPSVPVGIAVGYYENLLTSAILRFTDILLAFPGVLFSLALIAVTGGGVLMLIIAVAATFVPGYIRLSRALVLSVKQQEYVFSARAAGASDLRILKSHVLPNTLSPIIVQTTLNVSAAILISSSLSFLGLGIDPSLPEWGAMLNAGRDYLREAPWVSTFPGLAIMLVSLGFNLLGDGLRDFMDPRSR